MCIIETATLSDKVGYNDDSKILPLTHCKYLNARFECNDIVISVYSCHYPFDKNAKTFDTKGRTVSDDFAF